MEKVQIRQDIITSIIEHAKREAPIEACGYLASKNGLISRHYELTNTDKSEEHFSFDPKEQFATVKNAREKGFDIVAVYHSHPATPARPSNEDIRLAYDPDIHYVIVSLAEGKETVNAYRIIKTQEKTASVPEANAYDLKNDTMIVSLDAETKYLIEKKKIESL